MPLEAVIEWGITFFIFALMVGVVALVPWKAPAPPKDEIEHFPPATDGQGIIEAMNGLEACIDWRQGNTESNLILDDRKWVLFRVATREYGIIPTWNNRTKRWEEFDGKFR